MNTAGKGKNFLAKMQAWPDSKKKIVIWTIVVILGVIMGYFWVNSAIYRISKASSDMKNTKIPSVNMPNIPPEVSQKMGTILNQGSILNTVTPINK